MIWMIAVCVGILLVAIVMTGDASQPELVYPQGYQEDIDWSLMVKEYPVVNDVDIEYAEWLAANPGKVV